MRIGVYQGSFNPVHKGHIHLMDYLIDNNYLDKIIIVPSVSYWDKTITTPIKDRINMAKCIKRDYLIVEEELNEIPYALDLLNRLSERYPNDELFFIMAADNIIDFDKWYKYQELLKYKIIVLNRNNINIKEYVNKYKSNNFIIVQNFDYINISSTEIRNNKDNTYLDNNVLSYIINKHLYGR